VAAKGRDSFIDATLHTLEVISKSQIRFEGKAKADEKAQHTCGVCEHFEEAFNTAIER
jgi:hypothetical protein